MDKYKIVNGTAYETATPQAVIDILEESREHGTRLLFDYGDQVTGKSWGEVNDIRGYVGRSTGIYKIPLLIKTKRSMYGGALIDDCIVKISLSAGGRVLYQHPEYQPKTRPGLCGYCHKPGELRAGFHKGCPGVYRD